MKNYCRVCGSKAFMQLSKTEYQISDDCHAELISKCEDPNHNENMRDWLRFKNKMRNVQK